MSAPVSTQAKYTPVNSMNWSKIHNSLLSGSVIGNTVRDLTEFPPIKLTLREILRFLTLLYTWEINPLPFLRARLGGKFRVEHINLNDTDGKMKTLSEGELRIIAMGTYFFLPSLSQAVIVILKEKITRDGHEVKFVSIPTYVKQELEKTDQILTCVSENGYHEISYFSLEQLHQSFNP